MFGNQPGFKLYLLFLDTLLVYVALLIAGSGTSYLSICYVMPITLFALLFGNLYKRDVVYTRYRQCILMIKSLLKALIFSFLAMAVIQFRFFVGPGRFYLLKFFLFAIIFFIAYRLILVHYLIRVLSAKGFFNMNILIVGGGSAGIYAAETLKKDNVFYFKIAGFIDDKKAAGQLVNGKYKNFGKLEDIKQIIKSENIGEILIAIDGLPYEKLISIVERCLQTQIVVRVYSDFLDIISKKISVEYYANLPVVMLQHFNPNAMVFTVKRGFDIVLSVLALMALSPLLLIIIIGIKLSSRGPIIFKQKRVGKNGKPFDLYKFRSMHVNESEGGHRAYVEDFIKGKTCDGDEKIRVFKIRKDPRIFPFGRFIRKTSIDEFPQLYNVLKGDMSIVGPRPCLPYEWDCYDEWHKNRLNVLPGCTGLWQVLGRSTVTFEEMVVLDLYYISNINWLFWLDIKIILQTFPVIFLGKGGF